MYVCVSITFSHVSSWIFRHKLRLVAGELRWRCWCWCRWWGQCLRGGEPNARFMQIQTANAALRRQTYRLLQFTASASLFYECKLIWQTQVRCLSLFGMKVPHHGEVRLPNVKLAHWLTGQLADPIPRRRLRCVCTFRKRCRRIINCKLHSCNCSGDGEGDGDCLATCRQASQMRMHVCVRVGYTHSIHMPLYMYVYTTDYNNMYTLKWKDTMNIFIYVNYVYL